MPHVLEINHIEELAPYRFLWKGLLAKTPRASFFHTLEWLESYWRHFAADQRLRVLIVLDEGRPLGILPLVVKPEATRLGTVRVLTYPMAGWGSYYGPIGPQPAATLAAGLAHVQSTPHDWSMVDLRWINREKIDRRRTERALDFVGLPAREAVWGQTALVEFENNSPTCSLHERELAWEQYWASRPRKFRENLRRDQRRAERQGEVKHERYRPLGTAHGDDDPRWDLFEACVDVAARSWQGQASDGTTLSHDNVLPFLRETHEVAARLGMLDLNLLTLDDEPVGFAYNYVCDGSVYGLRAGFDMQHRGLGIGGLMFKMALEDSAQRGDVTYDFGPGSLEAKKAWQTRVAPIHHLVHYPTKNPKVQLLRAKHWWDGKTGQEAKKLAAS